MTVPQLVQHKACTSCGVFKAHRDRIMLDPILATLFPETLPNERKQALDILTSKHCEAFGVDCVSSSPCNLITCPRCLHRQYTRLRKAILESPYKYQYIRWSGEYPLSNQYPQSEYKRFVRQPRDYGLHSVGWISAPGVVDIDHIGLSAPTQSACSRGYVGSWGSTTRISDHVLKLLQAVKRPNRVKGNAEDIESYIELKGPFTRKQASEEILSVCGNDAHMVVAQALEDYEDGDVPPKFQCSF